MDGSAVDYRRVESGDHAIVESRRTPRLLIALSTVSTMVAASCLYLQFTHHAEVKNIPDVATKLAVPEEVVFLPIGKVRGKRIQLGGEVRRNFGAIFKGIPYGKAGRFQAPKDPDPVEFIDATEFQPSCMRSGAPRDQVSEDCLYLNVYAPRTSSTYEGNLLSPVLVWFHGGSFTMGAGSDTTDESVQELVVSHRLVVVTINYRLGAFGFLGSDKLRGWNNSTGNFGILDQQHALKWVNKHIQYFGGDKNQVGIVGWSAGAASVSVHLAAPSSFPYFKTAIMMSGGFTDWASTDIETTDGEYDSFIKASGCEKDSACMKYGEPCMCLLNLTVDEVLDAQNSIGALWAPTVDNVILYDSPMESLKKGKVHKGAQVIIGTAVEDALNDIGADATPEMFKDFITVKMPEKHQTKENLEKCYDLYMNPKTVSEVQALPGHSSMSPAYWAARRLVADKGMTCVARRAARLWTESSGRLAYWYLWEEGSLPLRQHAARTAGRAHTLMLAESAQKTAATDTTMLLEEPLNLQEFPSGLKIGGCWPCPGATHGSDLPFLFEEASTDVNDALADLADEYHTFFANFLINKDPNKWNGFILYKDFKPAWPGANAGGISFQAKEVVANDEIRAEFCDFWDSLE